MNKKLWAKLNTNVPESSGRDALVVHIAKESAPVVAFGGVGQVVGEISRWQASDTNTTVAVILPHYGFIDKWQKPETFAHFSFRLKHGTVHGKLYYLQRGEVSYFFVSSPSHMHDLWKSTHVEDVYNLPRRLFSKVLNSDRDLYFSFLAAHVVRFLSRTKVSDKKSIIAHVHGATNAAAMFFLRAVNEKFLSIIYTVHDYNAEPFISYDLEKIFSYSKRSSYRNFRYFGKERKLMHCDTEEPRKMRTKSFRGKKISSSEFAFCADIITTVSKGMIWEIMQRSEEYARLFITYESRGRLINVNNWIADEIWKVSRKLISYDDPSSSKTRAKRVLFKELSHFIYGQHTEMSRTECIVLWLGRFEANKGVPLLPYMHVAACSANCTLVVAGYATTRSSRKSFTFVQRALSANARRLSCPYFALTTLVDQRFNPLIRAAADIVVIPSLSEAYGLVAAESLAFGSIPVVSAVGGLPEIIKPFEVRAFAAPSWNWSGFQFHSYGDRWELTGVSMQASLKMATRMLWVAKQNGLIDSVQQNLIRSTPLARDSSRDVGFKVYDHLVAELVALSHGRLDFPYPGLM